MDSALLTPVEVLPAEADWAPLVVRLLAEVDQLRAEAATLRRDNLQLRQQAGYGRSRQADAVQRLADLHQEMLRWEARHPRTSNRSCPGTCRKRFAPNGA